MGYDLDRAASHRATAFVFADEKTAASARRALELMRGDHRGEALRQLEEYANLTREQKGGHSFEFLEALKFNEDAARKGATERAVTTASLGDRSAAADIIIHDQESVVREVQAKFYEDTPRALTELRQDKYDSMGRLVSADSEQRARELVSKRLLGDSAAINYSAYADVAANLMGSLTHGEISSGGSTRAEVLSVADDPVAFLERRRTSAVATSVVNTAVVGGLHAGAREVFSQLAEAATLEFPATSLVELLCDVGASVARTALTGASQAGLARAVHVAVEGGTLHAAVGFVDQGMLAGGIVAMADAGWSYSRGQIERDELVARCGEQVVEVCLSWVMGAIAQSMIPVPGVGFVAGQVASQVVSRMVEESLTIVRMAAAAADAAEDRLLELEIEVVHAIKRMEEERLALEALIDSQEATYAESILPLLTKVEASMEASPFDVITALIALNAELALTLEWQTLPEFDAFMRSDDVLRL